MNVECRSKENFQQDYQDFLGLGELHPVHPVDPVRKENVFT